MKQNNARILLNMFQKKHDSAVHFVKSLETEALCSLMFTNGIFALIAKNMIPELDFIKKKFIIETALANGYDYIPKTLAERCNDCYEFLYPEIPLTTPDETYNIVPDTSMYILHCDSEGMSYGVYVSLEMMSKISFMIRNGDADGYAKIHQKLMGRMTIDEFQIDHIEEKNIEGMGSLRSFLDGEITNMSAPCAYEILMMVYNDSIINEHTYNWYETWVPKTPGYIPRTKCIDLEDEYKYDI